MHFEIGRDSFKCTTLVCWCYFLMTNYPHSCADLSLLSCLFSHFVSMYALAPKYLPSCWFTKKKNQTFFSAERNFAFEQNFCVFAKPKSTIVVVLLVAFEPAHIVFTYFFLLWIWKGVSHSLTVHYHSLTNFYSQTLLYDVCLCMNAQWAQSLPFINPWRSYAARTISFQGLLPVNPSFSMFKANNWIGITIKFNKP